MAVKAADQISITDMTDVKSFCRYYLLQSSTLSVPSKPNTNPPPSTWTKTEPGYTAGSTNSLYFTDLTIYSNNTFSYSDVSLSSSYEAAKTAYNKAVEATKTATNYIDYTSANGLQVGDKTDGSWKGFRTQITSSVFNILNEAGETLASYGAKLIELGKNAKDAVIKFCGGKAKMGVVTYLEDEEVFEFSTDLPMELTARDTHNSRITVSTQVAPEGEGYDEGAMGSTMMDYHVYSNVSSHAGYDKDIVTGKPIGQASCGMIASLQFMDDELYENGSLSQLAHISITVDENGSAAVVNAEEFSIEGKTYMNDHSYIGHTKYFYATESDGSKRFLMGLNGDNLQIGGVGSSVAHKGDTIINAKNGKIIVNNHLEVNGRIYLPNNYALRGYSSDGKAEYSICHISKDDNIVLGTTDASLTHPGNTYVYAKKGNVYLVNKNVSVGLEEYAAGTDYTAFFRPRTTNIVGLGSASYKWYRLYQYHESVSVSDEREKYDIVAISELPTPFSAGGQNTLEMLFDRLIPKIYQLKGEKSEKTHIGFIAQDISKSLEEIGMSEEDLGIISHEYWTDEETGEVKDEYGLAYSEFIALNTHMIQKLRKENEELKERLEKIETILNITN